MKKPYHLWIGLGCLLIFQTALVLRIEPVTTYFYSLIWWSYIVMIDGFVFRLRGNSLIVNQTRRFFLLIPWSVAIWLIFEGFNLVLKNWHYVGVTKEMMIRWPGYFVAFGTVLPAILETKDFLSVLGIFEKSSSDPYSGSGLLVQAFDYYRDLVPDTPFAFSAILFPSGLVGFCFSPGAFQSSHRKTIPVKRSARGENRKPISASIVRHDLRPALGILEFLGLVQMDLHRPYRGTNKTFRNAGPGLFRISTLCPGMFCHGSFLTIIGIPAGWRNRNLSGRPFLYGCSSTGSCFRQLICIRSNLLDDP